MTLAALFFLVSAADSGKPADSKRTGRSGGDVCQRRKRREQRGKRKKRRKCRSRNRAVQTKICFGQLILQDFDQKNREICAWLWIPGCALDVPGCARAG